MLEIIALLTLMSAPPAPPAYSPEIADRSWSPEKAALGRSLFFDPLLSGDRTVSCASCHQPQFAFADPRRFSEGVNGQKGGRNAPALINRAMSKVQFWDGRAATLEAQALGPIANPVEMSLPISEAVSRLNENAHYAREFRAVFGGPPSAEMLGSALAAFERTIFSAHSPFDRFIAGDATALTPSAQRGLALFGDKAGCSACHSGINFSDEAFHTLGVGGLNEPGRMKVTGKTEDFGSYKTPTLREVALTAPYMHDGSIATLEEVVDYYVKGGAAHPNRDAKLKPLMLTTAERADLVAFLNSLSGVVVSLARPLPSSQ